MPKGDNMKTVAARALQSQRMHGRWDSAAWRLKSGYLLAHERAQIIEAARSGRAFIEIAVDWDMTISNVCHIARSAGLRRQRARRS